MMANFLEKRLSFLSIQLTQDTSSQIFLKVVQY